MCRGFVGGAWDLPTYVSKVVENNSNAHQNSRLRRISDILSTALVIRYICLLRRKHIKNDRLHQPFFKSDFHDYLQYKTDRACP